MIEKIELGSISNDITLITLMKKINEIIDQLNRLTESDKPGHDLRYDENSTAFKEKDRYL